MSIITDIKTYLIKKNYNLPHSVYHDNCSTLRCRVLIYVQYESSFDVAKRYFRTP